MHYNNYAFILHVQGGPKKQPPSDIAITQPKIDILISCFQGLKRRYFDTGLPNFILKNFGSKVMKVLVKNWKNATEQHD